MLEIEEMSPPNLQQILQCYVESAASEDYMSEDEFETEDEEDEEDEEGEERSSVKRKSDDSDSDDDVDDGAPVAQRRRFF